MGSPVLLGVLFSKDGNGNCFTRVEIKLKKLLSAHPQLYQDELLEPSVQTIVSSNKIKFEPHEDLVDEASSRYNANNMLDNQDPFGQIKNDEIREFIPETKMIRIQSQTETLQFQNVIPRTMADEYQLQ